MAIHVHATHVHACLTCNSTLEHKSYLTGLNSQFLSTHNTALANPIKLTHTLHMYCSLHPSPFFLTMEPLAPLHPPLGVLMIHKFAASSNHFTMQVSSIAQLVTLHTTAPVYITTAPHNNTILEHIG